MSAFDITSPYFRYVVATLYFTEACVVLFILLIELRTFYHSIYHRELLRTSTQSPKSKEIAATPTPTPTSKSMDTSNNTDSKNANEAAFIFLLPVLSYSFYIITGLCGAISILGVPGCIGFAYTGPSCYVLAKMFMYLLFIYRLWIVYSDSVFAYNHKVLLVLLIVVLIYSLGIGVMNGLTLDIKIVYNTNNQRICATFGQSTVLLIWTAMDMIISILCCYLFVRPLLTLNRQIDDDIGSSKHIQTIYHIILKYVILTFIAVITTFLCIGLMVISKFSALITMDMIVNCFCILLFNKYYDDYYIKICCGTMAICHKICKTNSK